jgi:hypothetical protein
MGHHQDPSTISQTHQNKPLLLERMVGIVQQSGEFIIEDGFGFFKGYAMLFLINSVFATVPRKGLDSHNYNIFTI